MLIWAMVKNLQMEDDKIKYKSLENQFKNLYTISEKAKGRRKKEIDCYRAMTVTVRR
jgi:hypothetical protein